MRLDDYALYLKTITGVDAGVAAPRPQDFSTHLGLRTAGLGERIDDLPDPFTVLTSCDENDIRVGDHDEVLNAYRGEQRPL